MLQNQKQIKVRNSSIELLRIIAMIMIVSCHFATHGGFSFDPTVLSVPRLWWNFLELGGNLGVNVFVLISGYFLAADNGPLLNLNRVLKFWGQVFVYSVAFYFLFVGAGIQDFGPISCFRAFLPITFNAWWFASTYFVLYLLHPFINLLLRKLDKKTYQALIAMLLIFWCVIPTFTTSNFQSNSLLWFITLYCVAGYIRFFGLNPRFTAKSYWGFCLVFSALRYASCIALIALGTKIPAAAAYSLFFYRQQSALTFLSAVSLFMAFEKWNPGHIRWINLAASATFGVYLIHDSNLVRDFLWQQVFKNAQYQDSWLFIPYSVIATAVVYVVCTLIDLLRQQIIERPFMVVVNRCSGKITGLMETALSIAANFIFGREP